MRKLLPFGLVVAIVLSAWAMLGGAGWPSVAEAQAAAEGWLVKSDDPALAWRDVGGGWYVVPASLGRTRPDLAADPSVADVEPNWIATASADRDSGTQDPLLGQQWHIPKVAAPSAWAVTRGERITIAILDTGVNCAHEDLAGRCSGDADDHGHGTHVAGIAAASADNGKGGVGVSAASILSVKVLNASGSGDFGTIAAGIRRAADAGAGVINMSLGCVNCPSQAMQDAVTYARHKGVVVVAAAGNHGSDAPSMPGYYAFAVAATDQADRLAAFSGRGSWVAVAAPGVDILSTLMSGGYGTMSGTSMASPVAAGVAALVRQACPACDVSQVEARLRDGDNVGLSLPRLNAYRAVTGQGAPPPGPTATAAPTATPRSTASDAEVMRLVNVEREKAGLAPLTTDGRLVSIAHSHNRAMQDCAINRTVDDTCFAHQVPGEPSVCDRFTSIGLPCGGETIGHGYETASDMVSGWLGSPAHREILLAPGWTTMGCAADDFENGAFMGLFYTCDFSGTGGGVPPRPTQTPLPPPSDAPRWDAGQRGTPFRLLGISLGNQQVLGLVHDWAFNFNPTYNAATPGFLFKDASGRMTPGNTDAGAVSVDLVGGFLWTRTMDQKLYQLENLTGLHAQWGSISWK